MSHPTEPTQPPVAHEGAPEVAPGQPPLPPAEPAAEPDHDTAAEGVAARRGGAGRRHHHGGRRRGVAPVVEPGAEPTQKKPRRERKPKKRVEVVAEAPQEVDPVLERAKLVFAEAKGHMYDILSNPAIERSTDEGDGMEEIPEEEWSFAAKAKQYAKSKLDFDYEAVPPEGAKKRGRKQHGKKQHERPYKEIKLDQTADDHSIARDNIVYLVTEVFAADMARIDAEIAAARTKADVDSKGAEVLEVREHAADEQGPNPTLEEWLISRKVQLEWSRVDVIRDAADWFDVRVDQVERMMHDVTKRTDRPSSVDVRLGALTTHEEFLAQEENLRDDIKMFESFLQLPITPGAEATRKVVQRIVEDAKKKVAKLATQKGNLLKLKVRSRWDKEKEELVVDEEHGNNPVENARVGIMRDMLDLPIAEKFAKEAEKRLIGLSPEEELNFWKAIRDLFIEVEPEVGKEVKGAAKQQARVKRLERLNAILGLYKVEGGQHFLVKIEDRADVGEKLPYGFGQIVEKCRREAKLLGELKEQLFFLMTKLGYETRKATQTALRGHSNSEKITATEGLNKKADKARTQAFKDLQASDPEFVQALAGRDVKALRWNRKEEGQKEADRPLLLKLRGKMLELMELGTLENIDQAELRDILFPEPVAAAGTVEKGETVTAPLMDRLASGDLPEEWFVGQETTAELWKEMATGLSERLGKALQSGVVGEAITQQFALLQPKELNLQTVQKFLDQIEALVRACETYKETFGQDWCVQFGLRLLEAKGPKRGVANVDQIVRTLEFIGADGDAVRSVMFAGNPHVMLKVALEKLKIDVAALGTDQDGEVKLGIKIGEAMKAGTFSEITVETLKGWLSGDDAAEMVDEGGESDAADPTEMLKHILNGALDAELVAVAYPHEDGQPDVTVESVRADVENKFDRIEQAAGSAALREAVVESYVYATTNESDPSAAENLKELVGKFTALADWAESMTKLFGTQWAETTGLLQPPAEGEGLAVNTELLQKFFEAIAEDYDSYIDRFLLAAGSAAEQKLLETIDPASREKLNELGVTSGDQMLVVVMTTDTDVAPAVALQRLGVYLDLGNIKHKRSEDLMKSRGLLVKEGDEWNFNVTAIKEVIMDPDFDRAS